MKAISYGVLGTLLVALFSQCNPASNKSAKETDLIPGTTDTIIAPRDKQKDTSSAGQDSIHIDIKKGETKTVSAKMAPEVPVTFSFDVEEPSELEAMVKPDDKNGNVRISVLIDPNGKSDGPYSLELKRSLTQPGMYRIVVYENMMAGDRWTGTFKLTLSLK